MGPIGGFQGSLGVHLGSSWGLVGVQLGSSWGPVGVIWVQSGLSQSKTKGILGLF